MGRKTSLRKCFEDFNHRFFNDRLYDIDVKWSKGKELIADGENVCGYYYDPSDINKAQQIVIARKHKSSKWIWRLILIHEMVHADLWLTDHIDTANHPPVFDDSMLKLANAGALVGLW